MVGEEQPILTRRQLHQREANERRCGEVELRRLFIGSKRFVCLLASAAGQVGEVMLGPWHVDVVHDDLNRGSVCCCHERRSQVLVAVEQCLSGAAKTCCVDGPFESEHHLHRVHVERGSSQQCVELQARLQRCQRPDVGGLRVQRLDRVDVALRQREKWDVGRSQATGSWVSDVICEFGQRRDPQIGQVLHVRRCNGSGRERKRRNQFGRLTRALHDGIDVDRLVGGHIGIAEDCQVVEIGGR